MSGNEINAKTHEDLYDKNGVLVHCGNVLQGRCAKRKMIVRGTNTRRRVKSKQPPLAAFEPAKPAADIAAATPAADIAPATPAADPKLEVYQLSGPKKEQKKPRAELVGFYTDDQGKQIKVYICGKQGPCFATLEKEYEGLLEHMQKEANKLTRSEAKSVANNFLQNM